MYGRIIKYIFRQTYRPFLLPYLKKERKYYSNNLRLVVLPGVFHPGSFPSTRYLLETLKTLDLKDKQVLELGAGTGMLSVFCAKQKAFATASDISWKAIINIDKNTRWNRVVMTIIRSDLFGNIPKQIFDYILINPPYLKKDPIADCEYSLYCGKNMEYFSNLFDQLPDYLNGRSTILMALSEDADIEQIRLKAEKKRLNFNLLSENKFAIETIRVYKLSLNTDLLQV